MVTTEVGPKRRFRTLGSTIALAPRSSVIRFASFALAPAKPLYPAGDDVLGPADRRLRDHCSQTTSTSPLGRRRGTVGCSKRWTKCMGSAIPAAPSEFPSPTRRLSRSGSAVSDTAAARAARDWRRSESSDHRHCHHSQRGPNPATAKARRARRGNFTEGAILTSVRIMIILQHVGDLPNGALPTQAVNKRTTMTSPGKHQARRHDCGVNRRGCERRHSSGESNTASV